MNIYHIDSVIANVYDIDKCTQTLYQRLGITPFMKMAVPIRDERVPMVLFKIGSKTIELLEYANTPAIEGISGIQSVTIQYPVAMAFQLELEAGLWLNIEPNDKPDLTAIDLLSSDISSDLRMLEKISFSVYPNEARAILKDTKLQLHGLEIQNDHNSFSYELLAHQAGWRRFTLEGAKMDVMAADLTQAGAKVLTPPFQVMPGLLEAFFITPSGIIIQPVEQNLLKLIPASIWRRIKAKFNQTGESNETKNTDQILS